MVASLRILMLLPLNDSATIAMGVNWYLTFRSNPLLWQLRVIGIERMKD